MNLERINTLRSKLDDYEVDGAVVIPGPTMQYLTGHKFHLMERPVFLLVGNHHDPVIILPELESGRVTDSKDDLNIFPYAEDDASRSKAIEEAVNLIGLSARAIAVEPLILRYFELELLRAAAPNWSFQAGEGLFSALRIHKDQFELEHMHTAVQIAENALEQTLPLIRIGMTERELAAELVIQLLRAGSDSDLPFQPIVASGPNSALPHSTPTERKLSSGDLLILDWGARSEGYISDITRTFAVGEIDPEDEKVYQIVLEANNAGRAAVRPGATCDSIDHAAREVIEASGYGRFFIHRTGHGIGLEAHEPPNIRSGEMQILEHGMTFTVEPGIYLPGKAGVRIEDNIFVTADEEQTLTKLNRSLDVVG
jgi:Xaa-Pro dipeptidase